MYLLLLLPLLFSPTKHKDFCKPYRFKLAMQQSLVMIKITKKSHMY